MPGGKGSPPPRPLAVAWEGMGRRGDGRGALRRSGSANVTKDVASSGLGLWRRALRSLGSEERFEALEPRSMRPKEGHNGEDKVPHGGLRWGAVHREPRGLPRRWPAAGTRWTHSGGRRPSQRTRTRTRCQACVPRAQTRERDPWSSWTPRRVFAAHPPRAECETQPRQTSVAW